MDVLEDAINKILNGGKLTAIVKDKELRKTIVYHLHTSENMGIREIARFCKIDDKTVYNYIKEYVAKVKKFNSDELNEIALKRCNDRIKELREIIEDLKRSKHYNSLAKFYNLLRREEELRMNLQGLLSGSIEGGVGGRNVNIVIMSNIRRGEKNIKNITPDKRVKVLKSNES